MQMSLRRVVIGGGVLVGLLAIVVLVLVATVDSERVGRTVLERAGQSLGLELTADRFDFHLLRGLEIEGLTARGSLAAGELDGRVESLVLRHELWPLVARRVVVRELTITSPRWKLVSGDPPAGGGEPREVAREAAPRDRQRPPGTSGLQLEIHQVRVEDGELILASTDPAVAPTEVHGLDLVLEEVVTADGRAPGLGAVRANGELAVERTRLGDLEATAGRGRVSLEEGHLRLREGHLTLEAGEVRSLDLDLDLTTEPFGYDLVLGAEPLRTERLLSADGAEGESGGFGPGRLELTARGRGGDLRAMDGEGTLALEGGTLPSSAVLLAIDALVEGAALVGADYQPVDVRFDIGSGRVEIQPFRLVAGGTTLDVRGSAEPGGAWDLWLSLAVPRHGIDIQEIPRELLDILTDDDGRLHLPLRVTGSAERVRVVPDPDALARATREGAQRRLQRRIEDELTRGLQRLFGGDDGGG